MKTHLLPSEIITGEGSIDAIVDLVSRFDSKRVLVFLDPILAQIGLMERVATILEKTNVEFDFYVDITPEPTIEEGNLAVKKVIDYSADLIIGIGGGSCLDCAKTAAVIAKQDGTIEDYLNLTGKKKLSNQKVKTILIPSTSGTGAEVTPNAVFSLGDTKDVISDKHLFADVAIIDPEITYTMPPNVTASSGMDALIHALESFTSKGASELTDALALVAIKKIYSNIRRAVWNGDDKKARSEMAWGSLISSLSYPNSLCHGVHSLSYPLGGLFKIPHGQSNAVLLPYVFDFLWPSCTEKMRVIADAMGIANKDLTDRETSLRVVKEFYNLIEEIGLPTTIKQYGIKEEDIDSMAENAIKQTRLLSKSPREFKLDDIKAVYRAAYYGELQYDKI